MSEYNILICPEEKEKLLSILEYDNKKSIIDVCSEFKNFDEHSKTAIMVFPNNDLLMEEIIKFIDRYKIAFRTDNVDNKIGISIGKFVISKYEFQDIKINEETDSIYIYPMSSFLIDFIIVPVLKIYRQQAIIKYDNDIFVYEFKNYAGYKEKSK